MVCSPSAPQDTDKIEDTQFHHHTPSVSIRSPSPSPLSQTGVVICVFCFLHIMAVGSGSTSRPGTPPYISILFSDSSSDSVVPPHNANLQDSCHRAQRSLITEEEAFAAELTPFYSLSACHSADRAMPQLSRSITSRDISSVYTAVVGMLILSLGMIRSWQAQCCGTAPI